MSPNLETEVTLKLYVIDCIGKYFRREHKNGFEQPAGFRENYKWTLYYVTNYLLYYKHYFSTNGTVYLMHVRVIYKKKLTSNFRKLIIEDSSLS